MLSDNRRLIDRGQKAVVTLITGSTHPHPFVIVSAKPSAKNWKPGKERTWVYQVCQNLASNFDLWNFWNFDNLLSLYHQFVIHPLLWNVFWANLFKLQKGQERSQPVKNFLLISESVALNPPNSFVMVSAKPHGLGKTFHVHCC